MAPRISTSALLAAAALGLGACSTYDDGYGYRYDGAYYGYGNGQGYYDYGTGYYGDGYAHGGYYPQYPGAYYPVYFGWYNQYYYPGTGYYIYSRLGDRYRWDDATRRYWETRRSHYRDRYEHRGPWRDNWSGYVRHRDGHYYDPRPRPPHDERRRGDRRYDRR